jgi:hypothetical protein
MKMKRKKKKEREKKGKQDRRMQGRETAVVVELTCLCHACIAPRTPYDMRGVGKGREYDRLKATNALTVCAFLIPLFFRQVGHAAGARTSLSLLAARAGIQIVPATEAVAIAVPLPLPVTIAVDIILVVVLLVLGQVLLRWVVIGRG